MSAEGFNPFRMAQAQFDKVADQLDLDEPTRELLRNPMREAKSSRRPTGHT